MSINDKEWLTKSIKKESCPNGWNECKIDIGELEGEEIFVEIRQEFNVN